MPTTYELPRWTAKIIDKKVVLRFPREQMLSRLPGLKDEDVKAFIYKYSEVLPSQIKEYCYEITDTDIYIIVTWDTLIQ
jgi:hypothetical protein